VNEINTAKRIGKAIKPATMMKLGRTANVPINFDCRIFDFLINSESEGWENLLSQPSDCDH
jgi:hypothetical protein